MPQRDSDLATRYICYDVLRRRVRYQPAIPVMLAIELNGRKSWRQGVARHPSESKAMVAAPRKNSPLHTS